MENLLRLEKILGYQFKDKNLLLEALTHPSYAGDGHDVPHYERLEFLGDAVAELVVSEYLFKKFPQLPEGELTKMRSMLVNRETMADDALKIGLSEFIILGVGEMRQGGKNRRSILSNTIEAIIGAVFIDGGYDAARKIAEKLIIGGMESKLFRSENSKNYKSLLQELVQKKFSTLPIYNVISEEGPPHDRVYEVEVVVKKSPAGRGRGKSIKEAELEAAKDALKKLEAEDENIF